MNLDWPLGASVAISLVIAVAWSGVFVWRAMRARARGAKEPLFVAVGDLTQGFAVLIALLLVSQLMILGTLLIFAAGDR